MSEGDPGPVSHSAEIDAPCPRPEPCDPDCEAGPVHCPNVHLPRYKWHQHTADIDALTEQMHAILVEHMGYAESPTMSAEMWPLARSLAEIGRDFLERNNSVTPPGVPDD